MTSRAVVAFLALVAAHASAQQVGKAVPEVHPKLTTQECTVAGGCAERQTSVVADALNRPLHAAGDAGATCTPSGANGSSCELEGVEYGSLGVLAQGSALTMRQYLFNGTGYSSVSPRLYLLAEDGENYELLQLAGRELTYDVDVSKLGCGMNGALYLSEMDASGSRSDLNPAGATYGTGYCDAQCFNVSFINGLPNLNNSGACCNEMDIWEANSRATALTPHTCSGAGSFLCAGDECGATAAGVCDKDGCGLNPFRDASHDFYGPGKTVDTTKPFTVVTQFVASSGGSNTNSSAGNGTLTDIRRLYIQDGQTIESPPTTASGGAGQADGSSGVVSQGFCTEKNASDFLRLGGMQGMGASLARGMVLVFSIWNSDDDFMTWLDSGEAGPCSATEGDPQKILANDPDVSVTFSNIRWGEIGSTFNKTGAASASAANALNAQSTSTAAGFRVVEGSVWATLAIVAGYFVLDL